MRIVTRAEFLALPEETVFAKYRTFGTIGEICVKGRSFTNDFQYQPLANSVDCHDSEEFFDVIEAAEKGKPFKLDLDCINRDGYFDDDQLFAIWEPDDVRQLIERLQRCVVPASADPAMVEAAGPIVDEMLAPLRKAMAPREGTR